MPDSLPQSAEIVVIGGGIVGCSTTVIAKRGKKDVLLLERIDERDHLAFGGTSPPATVELQPDDTDEIQNSTSRSRRKPANRPGGSAARQPQHRRQSRSHDAYS